MSTAMSEAGSLLSDGMDIAVDRATDMIRMPLVCAGIGLGCL